MPAEPSGTTNPPKSSESHETPTRTYHTPRDDTYPASGSTAVDLALPERVDRFAVVRLLGSGAFGVVLLARDRDLERDVAIKVPRNAGRCGEKTLDGFVREAKVACQFQHPHAVAVYDARRDPEFGAFIVMEYVAGDSLAQRLADGPLDPREAARVAAQVADALQHSHSRHLVHRDLKPSNILFDAAGNAKVCDFGLALHDESQHERRGELAGTYPYMAPEQVRAEFLDGRCDIWALGVVLYECLTGRRPFHGENSAQVWQEILDREPKPPRQIVDAIPAELERICLRCLAKSPKERPSTAADVRRALLATLTDAAPVPPTGRRYWWAIAAVTAIAVLVAGVAWMVAGSGSAKSDSPNGGNPPAGPKAAPQTDLLARAPKTVIFEDEPFNVFAHDAKRHQFSVKSDSRSMFQLGDMPESDFEILTVMQLDKWEGTASVFWGWHLDPAGIDRRQYRCMAVSVRRNANDGLVRLDLVRYKLREIQPGVLHFEERRVFKNTSVPAEISGAFVLRLWFEKGRLVSAGIRPRGMPEEAATVVRYDADLADWASCAAGGVGIMCRRGNLVVSRAFLQPLGSEE